MRYRGFEAFLRKDPEKFMIYKALYPYMKKLETDGLPNGISEEEYTAGWRVIERFKGAYQDCIRTKINNLDNTEEVFQREYEAIWITDKNKVL